MPEHHEVLDFLLLLALIVAAAKAGGWLSLRAGQPAVLGELLAGVVLGPSVLDLLGRGPFAGEAQSAGVFLLANLGVVLLMFVAGLETDLEQMRRVGRVAVAAGVAGVVAPLLLGVAVTLPFGFDLTRSLFMGIVLTATSVSITVQTLIELGQLTSKEGVTLLGAAVVDDVIALIVLSVFLALTAGGSAEAVGAAAAGAVRAAAGAAGAVAAAGPAAEGGGTGGAMGLVVVAGRMGLYFAAALVLGRLVRPLLARAARAPVSEGLLAATLFLVLLYAWAAEAGGGVAAITGAYLAGVLVAQAGFRHEVEQRLRAFIYAVLVPVFFVSIGLQTNARALTPADLPLALAVVAAAIAGKVAGCGGGARLAGFTGREALRIGVGMISRGEVGLIIASIGLAAGLLEARGFAIMVIMVLATTVVTPPLLRAVFPRRPLTEEEAVREAFKEEPERQGWRRRDGGRPR
ncbi:MAG: cation:proton antiporter [Armatimonadota bacterium]|nr:cation:proton antiporter [Armatimonadota bacterium]